MKDQYFGDVNDFRKYGLIRALALPARLRTGLCWMLTEPDGRADGGHVAYLTRPASYRAFDPELFDYLSDAVTAGLRRTSHIEPAGLLGEAAFHSSLLTDNRLQRGRWFAACVEKLRGCDLAFFDPDNGMERSIRYGARNSSKYLYWAEVCAMFAEGPSVLIYQHFPRENRAAFTDRLCARLRHETGACGTFVFRTPHVLFALASQARHVNWFRNAIGTLERSWPSSEIAALESDPL